MTGQIGLVVLARVVEVPRPEKENVSVLCQDMAGTRARDWDQAKRRSIVMLTHVQVIKNVTRTIYKRYY